MLTKPALLDQGALELNYSRIDSLQPRPSLPLQSHLALWHLFWVARLVLTSIMLRPNVLLVLACSLAFCATAAVVRTESDVEAPSGNARNLRRLQRRNTSNAMSVDVANGAFKSVAHSLQPSEAGKYMPSVRESRRAVLAGKFCQPPRPAESAHRSNRTHQAIKPCICPVRH